MTVPTAQEKVNALQIIINRLEAMGQYSAKFLMYVSAIGAITIMGGINLPPELTLLLEGIGVNIISSLIERVARGENISDNILKHEIKTSINVDKLETLLSTNDFFRAIAKLRRNQDVALFKLQAAEFNVIEKLDEILGYLRETRYLSDKTEYPFPPYVAHPYTLSEQHGFFGRHTELLRLTKWAKQEQQMPILFVVGFGGTGKSALVWNWFNDLARNTSKWAGMLWWSFYKTDSSFGDFIVHSLAYVSGQSVNEIRSIPRVSQEQLLINHLSQNPFLLVIDGLERQTLAYAEATLPQEKIYAPRKHLSQMTDERDGRFLLYLTKIKQSRVLITSRVYPFDLCDPLTSEKIPGSYFFLKRMKDRDALALWNSMGIGGNETTILALLRALHRNPLLIKVLAASIMKYRQAPGDFEKWALENKRFNPYQYTSLRETIFHVFQNTIVGINDRQAKILEVVSALRTPIRYELLSDLFVGKIAPPYTEYRFFSTENSLDSALLDLEERGLLAWDAINNVYDIHPLVRDFIWFSLSKDSQEKIIGILTCGYTLLNILESLSTPKENRDFSVTTELFYLLMRFGEYQNAWILFNNNFPIILQAEGLHHLRPMLNTLANIALQKQKPFDNLVNFGHLLGCFTAIHMLKGNISNAKRVAKSQLAIFLHEEYFEGIIRSQLQLSLLFALSGDLKLSEQLAIDSLKSSRLHFNLNLVGLSQLFLGLIKSMSGEEGVSTHLILSGSEWIAKKSKTSFERDVALFIQSTVLAQDSSTLPIEYSQKGKLFTLILYIMQGGFAIDEAKFDEAQFIMSDTLIMAKKMGLTIYELIAISMQAELALRQGDKVMSRKLITSVLSYSDISEITLIYLGLLNTLAEIELSDSNNSDAVSIALKAYEIAFPEREYPSFKNELERAANVIREGGGRAIAF